VRFLRSLRNNELPVRIVLLVRICTPSPVTERKREVRVVVLLPGHELAGFAEGFRGKQGEREWNRDATHVERHWDVRQLLAVGRRESVTT